MNYINYNSRQEQYDLNTHELTADSPLASPPRDTNVVLRAHQLALLHRCRNFERGSIQLRDFSIFPNCDGEIDTNIGVVGDMVGSGKSYVLLALIMDTPCFRPRARTKIMSDSRVIVTQNTSSPTDNGMILGNTLLVVPHNIVNQWQTYVQNYSDALWDSCAVVNRNKNMENIDVKDMFTSNKLVIVTSTFYNRLAMMIKSANIVLNRLVFDEADSLQIPACATLDASFTWFVTASYANLLFPKGYIGVHPVTRREVMYASGLHNSGFIKNVFQELYMTSCGRKYSRALVVRNSDNFVLHSIRLPEVKEFIAHCKTPQSISMLYGFVEQEIINHLNAGDVDGAIQYVNQGNRNTEENIVALAIRKYENQISRMKKRVIACENMIRANTGSSMACESSSSVGTSMSVTRISETIPVGMDADDDDDDELYETELYVNDISRTKAKIEELQVKIDGIRKRVIESDTCHICLDVIQNKSVVKCCCVPFCFQCIKRWTHVSGKCPLCKCRVTPVDITLVISKDSFHPSDIVPPKVDMNVFHLNDNVITTDPTKDKLQNLKSILRCRDATSKFLIFSSFEGSFDGVSRLLRSMNISFAYLKGNTSQICSLIRSYEAGNTQVLLVNGTNYGSGLNLQMTTDIVMFHRFQSEIQKQVVGRAQRYGRTQSLRLWYLLYENEIA